MAVHVNTQYGPDLHPTGRTAKVDMLQGRAFLAVRDAEGKGVSIYSEWVSATIEPDDSEDEESGGESAEGEDAEGEGTVWVKVLPDMDEFVAAMDARFKDVKVVMREAPRKVDLFARNAKALVHEMRHPLNARFNCGDPECYLPTEDAPTGCPCGVSH